MHIVQLAFCSANGLADKIKTQLQYFMLEVLRNRLGVIGGDFKRASNNMVIVGLGFAITRYAIDVVEVVKIYVAAGVLFSIVSILLLRENLNITSYDFRIV